MARRMTPGHHVLVAYNDHRGTIRVRRPTDRPDERDVLIYPDTPIAVFDGPPAAWPVPAVRFRLRAHEIDALRTGL